MDIQALLFSRADGWTASKAKEWAKSHGYKHGKVHVTDQYVRIRQFDPKGLKVKRTITLGSGIRAVVAREEDMAAKRKRSKKSAAKTTRRRATRRTRETPVAEARRPRRRRARESAATEARKPRRRRPSRRVRAEAPRSRPRRRRAPAAGQMMESSRRSPRRRPRRRARVQEAWHGDRPGHRKAAKKGWERRKRKPARRRRTARESGVVAEARRPRRRRSPNRRRRTREFAYESPRRARRPRRAKHRRSRARESTVMEARRPSRRRSYVRARGGSSGYGEKAMEIAAAVVAGGIGFVLADAVDRFLATYDPSSTAAKPTDKFTSDGAGTLANTLNVAATPNLYRVGAAVGFTVLPAVASVFVDNPFARSSLEGMAVGGGVSLFKLLWNNVVVPMLAPKDTSAAGLQKSVIARLYPAEIAASINLSQKPPQQAAQGVAFGALSQPPPGSQPAPQAGVGAPPADVGPFALSGSSDYPDAAQALRRQAGVQGPGGNYPSMQNVWGTGDYPTAQQAMGVGDIVADMAKTVATTIPGAHPAAAAKAAGDAASKPHDIAGALMLVFPHVPAHLLMECARQLHPHVAKLNAVTAPAAVPAAPPVPPAAPGVTGVSQPPAYQPGPASTPGPGPQPLDKECGCGVGDDNQFLGFVGDGEEKDVLYNAA